MASKRVIELLPGHVEKMLLHETVGGIVFLELFDVDCNANTYLDRNECRRIAKVLNHFADTCELPEEENTDE